MPKMAERKDVMTSNCPGTDSLSLLELAEIALYTVQKINNYPKSFGKTVENYFHLLYPDEIKAYLMRRTINNRSFSKIGIEKNKERRALDMSAYARQVRDLRTLCQLLVEQQEGVLSLISDKLDELEADLSVSDADKEGVLNGK
jgi:hypothetical protein